MDPEQRFIQIAEESSRPAFQSIESLVSAIGNIAAMLDSTFFAITSSFRAILGVAANFGRLRGVFAQFWQTFAIFRGLTWLYKKILYYLRLSNVDPSVALMGEAFAAAQQGLGSGVGASLPKSGTTAWPILVFLGFIFTAPYLIMKLLGTVSQSALEESKNPRTWINPIKAQVKHNFQATNPQELSMRMGQTIYIAPREIQNTQHLLNTGWVLATVDNEMSGIIPLNYIQAPQQVKQQEPVLTPMSSMEVPPVIQPKIFNESSILGPAPFTENEHSFLQPKIDETIPNEMITQFNNQQGLETGL